MLLTDKVTVDAISCCLSAEDHGRAGKCRRPHRQPCAAKAYAKEREQEFRDEMERNRIKAELETIGPLWNFLLKSGVPDDFHTKLDNWVEELTGDRTYFHARERKKPA